MNNSETSRVSPITVESVRAIVNFFKIGVPSNFEQMTLDAQLRHVAQVVIGKNTSELSTEQLYAKLLVEQNVERQQTVDFWTSTGSTFYYED